MKAKLQEAMKDALRAKKKVALETIRSLLSALQYEEMQKNIDELEEKQVFGIFKTEIKKRREELEFAERASRDDLKQRLNEEIEVIESFLPQQLSSDDIARIIGDLKEQTPDISMGAIMKALKDSYAGQYDGKLASEIVRKVLG